MATKQFLTDADFEDAAPLKPVQTGVLGRAGDLGLSVLKGTMAVPEFLVGVANIPTGGKAGKAVEEAGVRFKDAKQILDDQMSVAGQLAQRKYERAEGFTGKVGAAIQNPSIISSGIAESAGPMGAGMAVGRGLMAVAPRVIGGLAGAIGEGVVGAGSAAEQIRQQTADGELTGKQAALAGATGLATTAFGALGNKIGNKLGVGDIDNALIGGAASQAPAKQAGLAKRVAGGAFSEGALEELPQSVSEQMLQNVALDRDPTQGVDSAAAMGLVTGGAMGAGFGILNHAKAPAAAPEQATGGTQPGQTTPTGSAGPTLDAPAADQTATETLGQSLTGTPMADLMGGSGLSGGANPLQAGLSTLTSNNQMYPGMNTEPAGYTVDPETGAIIPAEPVGARQVAEPVAQVEAPAPAAQAPVAPAIAPPALGESLTGTPVADMLDTRTPSQRMGLNPESGGLTAAAAIAVDSGASPATAGMGLRALSGAAPAAQPVSEQAYPQQQAQPPAQQPILSNGKPFTLAEVGKANQAIGGTAVSVPGGWAIQPPQAAQKPAATPATAMPTDATPAASAQSAILGRNSQPIAEGGQPFFTREEAKAEKRMQPLMRVAPAEGGGFILKPASERQMAAVEKAAKRLKYPSTGETGPRSLHGFILQIGGLASGAMPDVGFDLNPRVGNRRLFSPRGKTIEQAAMAAKQEGYIHDEDENTLIEALKRSLNVSPVYTPDGYEAMAEAQMQARYEDFLAAEQDGGAENDWSRLTPEELAETGYNDYDEATQAEIRALVAQAEALGIDAESILEDVARRTENATQKDYENAAKSAIEAAIRSSEESRSRDLGQAGAEAGPATADTQAAPAAVTGPASDVRARNLAALKQRMMGQKKPTPATPPAQTKATPAPEAGPTNQGATNGQGQETLLKAEQPTGADVMVSGAPVAEQPSDTTKPGGFTEKVRKAAGKVDSAPAQQPAGSIDGIVIKPGKGLIKGKFKAEVDGVGLPGDAFNTEQEAYDAALKYRETLAKRANEGAEAQRRKDAIAESFRNGDQVTNAQIKSLGLKSDFSDMRWFMSTAADLFVLNSRQIRPIVKNLIKVRRSDMGTEYEYVPTRKALEAIAASQSLTSPTKADIEAQQARAEQAAKAKAAQDKADAARAAKERERKDVAAASVAAADTFELGQDAMANLTGQQDVFGAMEQEAKPSPPKATELTPKQYHEAKLAFIAADTGASMADVRENYDTEAGRAENNREWAGQVESAANAGEVLTRQTLDKLYEMAPNVLLPETAIPQGYQRPEARRAEAEDKQARVDGRKAAGKAAPATDAAQQTAGETLDANQKNSGGSLPSPIASKKTYSALLPFNIQGNKTQLLANGMDAFLRNAAKGARRVIDAFGGAAAYTHALAHNGDLPSGSVYNEFEPLRYIANKQIKENVEQVIARLEFHIGKINAMLATSEEATAKRKLTADYVINGINSHKQDGVPEHAKGLKNPPSNMDDSPDLAALYLIAQNSRFGYRPIQSDVGEDGKLRVMSESENELVAIREGGEKVTLFRRGKDKLINSASNLRAASKRLQGVDVRMGDGWMIGAKEASAGDVLLVDTSYLNKTDKNTGKTVETANYNKATQEDAIPDVYKEKVTENLLPAWDRGAKIVITNNWNDDVAAYLKNLGFTVIQDQRAKGVSNDTRELIAINFNQRTGAVDSRRGAVSGGSSRRSGKATDIGGNGSPGQDGLRGLAAGAEGQNGAIPRSGRGRLNPSTGAGKADARNAALTSVVRNGGNSTAVLTDIANNSKNPAFKLVSKAILAKGLPFDLRIRTDFTDGKVAHYSTDGHFVEFDPGMPFNLEQVLLHEAVHAVTSKYVASFGDSTPLGKELAALFKLAEQHAKKTGAKFYGLTNADEFLAEVMTNADFAQWLDTVPVPLQKSALSRFVRAVARFFGIQKADGATAQAMDVFERIMLAQSDLQAEASQKLSTSKDAAAVAQAYGVDTEEDGDTVYFGDAEVSLNREDDTYIVTSENEFTPDHRAAVAWAENNGFTSELAKSPSSKLTPVESMLRDALEATGDMGAAKDMAYEALRRQGVAVKWQDVVDAAKKMGRGTRASKPGADAIRSDTDASPRTQASTIRAAITNAYGNLLDKLEAKGLVTIAQTEREAIEAAAQARADKTGGDAEAIAGRMMSMAGLDVKYSANGNIEGFFDKQTGKSYLIADNLTAESAPGTLMHEVGIHMAADGKLEPLFTRAGNLLKTGTQNEFIQRVKARMARAGETSDEEAAAYIVTEYENDRAKAPITIGKWISDLTAAVRAWLFSKGIILKADQLTVADIAAVARANARSMARGGPNGGPGGGQAFSRTALPATLNIDGKDRPTTNSNGQPIHPTEEGVRNFWRWFKDSKAVDTDGQPLVSRSDLVRARQSAMLESGPDGGTRDSKSLSDLLVGKTFSLEGLSGLKVPSQREVLDGVLALGDDLKVLGSVVELVPVDVVNILARKNLAPEMLFRDEAVLKKLLSSDSDGSVSTAIDIADALVLAVARMAAKGSAVPSNPFAGSKKVNATARAGNADVFHDGIVNQTIGNTGAFSPTDPDIRFSRAADMAGNAIDKAKQTADKAMGKDFPRAASMPDLNDDQRSLLGKVGASQSPASDAIKAATDRAGLKIRQGMVDRFAALKELDEKALGQNFIADSITNSAWVLAKMSSAGSGALNAMMKSGRIEMDAQQKVIGLKGAPNGGLTASLQKLGGPAEVERFFAWMAANRAEKLMGEGRENLFTPAEIAAGKTLNTGSTEGGKVRPALYSQVHAEFQQYRDDVLAIAEQTGIINSDNRAMWRDEFYVPFYRVMEDDADRGRSGGNGLSRQEAYKKLKGGKQNLNDLMENTLMNFHHLLSASLKNQAAVQAIKNAETVGIARKVPEARRDTKTSTFVLVDGKKVFYEVDDPLVFESITTLADPGLNNTAVRVMGAFKRLFTNMTTSTPQFIIANTFRDLLQASATSPTSKNIAKNLKEGIQSYRDEKTRAEMLASGGAFSFGHIYGMSADEVKESLQKTVAGAGLISSPSMIPSMMRKMWDAWSNNITDLSENASRAATYTQNVDQMGKLRAAFEARDVMDFSQHGAWPAVRLLVRIVPFLNARLQGLDKLYRSGLKPSILTAMGRGTDTDKQAAARFAMVTGALTLATMALYMLNADDDEYKRLPEWQKDTYWFIRIGDMKYFLPKPFEVGAIATIAERTLQQAMDDKATGKLFRERMWEMLMQTFAFNPTPQMFQPLVDVYSNKDAFTGRDIETAGMERMSAGLRSRDTTTAPATAISAVSRVFGDESAVAVSPVQADHLIKGYLGGTGVLIAGVIDTMYRTATGESEPDKSWMEYQPFRRFMADATVPNANTRYSTLFYDGLREANRVYADVMELQKLGQPEDAATLAAEKRNVLQMRIALNSQQRRLTEINNRMKEVRRSDKDGEWKRREIDLLTTQKAMITERMGKRIEDARAGA